MPGFAGGWDMQQQSMVQDKAEAPHQETVPETENSDLSSTREPVEQGEGMKSTLGVG